VCRRRTPRLCLNSLASPRRLPSSRAGFAGDGRIDEAQLDGLLVLSTKTDLDPRQMLLRHPQLGMTDVARCGVAIDQRAILVADNWSGQSHATGALHQHFQWRRSAEKASRIRC